MKTVKKSTELFAVFFLRYLLADSNHVRAICWYWFQNALGALIGLNNPDEPQLGLVPTTLPTGAGALFKLWPGLQSLCKLCYGSALL